MLVGSTGYRQPASMHLPDMLSTSLFTPIGAARAFVYCQTMGPGGQIRPEPFPVEAAAILSHPQKGKLVLRGYCSVDSRSNAAAQMAFAWTKLHQGPITELLGKPPRVDLAKCTTLGSTGNALHDVDVVIRLDVGCRAVAQTASLVLALVAMAWNLPSPMTTSAAGALDTALGGWCLSRTCATST